MKPAGLFRAPTTGPAPYLEENLKLDYNRLEARNCFCTREKETGALMCKLCWDAVAPDVRAALEAMRPGEGLAAAADLAHNELARKRKAWKK
jgi:hypothetical protein